MPSLRIHFTHRTFPGVVTNSSLSVIDPIHWILDSVKVLAFISGIWEIEEGVLPN